MRLDCLPLFIPCPLAVCPAASWPCYFAFPAVMAYIPSRNVSLLRFFLSHNDFAELFVCLFTLLPFRLYTMVSDFVFLQILCVCVYLCVFISMCMCVSLFVCVYLCVYVCISVCTCESLCVCLLCFCFVFAFYPFCFILAFLFVSLYVF